MPKKVLVTGANGFVARYLIEALQNIGLEVIGVDIAQNPAYAPTRYLACNLLDAASVSRILNDERPDAIVHLAAVSSVGRSWQVPRETFTHNTTLFLNIAEAVREIGLKTRILSVGSSEEYGIVPKDEQPISERHPVKPNSPYAVARVAQEQLSQLYARSYGLDIVMTRSFNQIGPGQRTNFVVPSFVRQLVDGCRRGESVVRVSAGDLTIIRDFLDVRDAVAAYCLLLDRGVSGEIYNVCSGIGRTLRSVLDVAANLAGVKLDVTVDSSRIRPADNPMIVGDNAKMRALGWSLTHPLETSLRDMIDAAQS